MTENELLTCVIDLAHLYSWRVLHIRPARTEKGYRTPLQGDGVGWPDIFAVRDERIVVAELKSDRGRVTDEQQKWLTALSYALQANTYVWTPAEWENGTILRTLSAPLGDQK